MADPPSCEPRIPAPTPTRRASSTMETACTRAMPRLTHRRTTPRLHRRLFREKPNRSKTCSLQAGGCKQEEQHTASANTSPSPCQATAPPGEARNCHCGTGKGGSSSLLQSPTAPSPVPRAARALAGRFRRRPACQQGLPPGMAEQHRRWFQSGQQSHLKPSHAPQLTCLHTVLQGRPAMLMGQWGDAGTSAAGQAWRSWPGILLADAHPPQGQALASKTSPPRPGTEARRSSRTTQDQPCSQSVGCMQDPVLTLSTLVCLKRFLFMSQQLTCNTSRVSGSGAGDLTLLQPLQLRTQQESPSPPSTQREAAAACIPAWCSLQMAAAPGSCLQPRYRYAQCHVKLVCAALCRSSPSALTVSLF